MDSRDRGRINRVTCREIAGRSASRLREDANPENASLNRKV